MELLGKVGRLLEDNSFLIENIDATIIAQAPKMRPYIDTMRGKYCPGSSGKRYPR